MINMYATNVVDCESFLCNETSTNTAAKILKIIFDKKILITNQDIYLKKGGDSFSNTSYLMISETHVTISYIY